MKKIHLIISFLLIGSTASFSQANVGVGTNTPTLAKLQVEGKQGHTLFTARTAANGIGVSLTSSITDQIRIDFNSYFDAGASRRLIEGFVSQIRYNSTSGDLSIMYNTASGAPNTIPSLGVASTIVGGTGYAHFPRFTGFGGLPHPDSGRVAIFHNSTIASPTLQLVETNTTDYARIEFANQANARFWHIAGNQAGTGALDDRLNFYHSSAGDIISIRGDGRIGMGGFNSHATGYRLSVRGRIICEELRVNLFGAWPDYVFADNYQLRSIHQLEEYIQQNKHLPGMPAAAELEKEGLHVGDMQKRMVEKIEELTLYIIQLQKEIDGLKAKDKM